MRRVWLIAGVAVLSGCSTILSISGEPDSPPQTPSDASARSDAEGGAATDGGNPPPADAAIDADTGRPQPIAFVSSQPRAGNSGLAAFNALCQDLATKAGLPGTYAALLGTGGADPVLALRSTTWYRPDGQPLFTGSMTKPVQAFVTETNGVLPGSAVVWTGGAQSQLNCTDWSDSAARGGHGNPNATDSRWVAYGSSDCLTSYPVYCFEQQQ